MDNVETLRKLIDEDAITFMKKKENEENYDLQLSSFLKTNGYICGIDLSQGKDWTPIPPYK